MLKRLQTNYFNPRSPRGERPDSVVIPVHRKINFNPRSPRGERQVALLRADIAEVFQSTLPSRGATHTVPAHVLPITDFNPRSPRGERRTSLLDAMPGQLFQSTLPSRGATYPRPGDCLYSNISIHAPLAGSDPWARPQNNSEFRISIHAPLAGSDRLKAWAACLTSYFNPRSPRGERLQHCEIQPPATVFQSTLPSRGATSQSTSTYSSVQFQSTLPSRGATW